tara:strand:- start:469 stop:960 length:492 start_codon:yes stop_codon:yes gene_type:complete
LGAAVGLRTPGRLADLARAVDQHRETGQVLLERGFLLGQHFCSSFFVSSESQGFFARDPGLQLFTRGDFPVQVLDDVGASAGTVEREAGAGAPVVETERGVLVENTPPSGVEESLGQFPELRLQGGKLVAGDVQDLSVEHPGLCVLGRQLLLGRLVTFWKLSA